MTIFTGEEVDETIREADVDEGASLVSRQYVYKGSMNMFISAEARIISG